MAPTTVHSGFVFQETESKEKRVKNDQSKVASRHTQRRLIPVVVLAFVIYTQVSKSTSRHVNHRTEAHMEQLTTLADFILSLLQRSSERISHAATTACCRTSSSL